MNITRIILVGITLLITAYLMLQFYIWSADIKDTFLFSNDILSYIMIFILVIAITGIFKWFLKWEVKATRRKR